MSLISMFFLCYLIFINRFNLKYLYYFCSVQVSIRVTFRLLYLHSSIQQFKMSF